MHDFIGSSTSRGTHSKDSYQGLGTVYVDICPPIISAERKQNRWKKGKHKSVTFSLEALHLGQISIFWAVSRPQTSSADIPASGTGLLTKYQQKKMTFRVSRIEQTYRICCFY